MKINWRDLRSWIKQGIESAGLSYFQMTESWSNCPKPEYLTTSAICFSIAEEVKHKCVGHSILIRAEEKTRQVWGNSNVLKLLRGIGLHKRNSDRNGNVDITIYRDKSGVEQPFAVIENKGLLSFAADGNLYQNSADEISKDISRLVEFLGSSDAGGIEYGGFTFYLEDSRSVLSCEGFAYRAKKQQFFEALMQGLVIDPSVKFDVFLAALNHQLYESECAANADSEHGELDCSHVVFGIISLYRDDECVN